MRCESGTAEGGGTFNACKKVSLLSRRAISEIPIYRLPNDKLDMKLFILFSTTVDLCFV